MGKGGSNELGFGGIIASSNTRPTTSYSKFTLALYFRKVAIRN